MAEIASLAGVLVGFEERSYSGFVGSDGREVPGGSTLWVHVAEADGAGAPVGVKVKPDQFDALRSAGFGAWLACRVELRAKNNRLVRSLVEIDQVGEAAERGLSAV